MSGGDRTGPLGYGPMTGRGMGYCADYGAPGYATGGGFGHGRGFGGGGRGWRNMYYATGLPRWARGYPQPAWPGSPGPGYYGELTPEREVEFLRSQTDFFQKQIDALNERIREMEEIAVKQKKGNE